MTLYFESIQFDGLTCAISLANDDGERRTVTFRYVRNFAFIKESYFGEEFRNMRTEQILDENGCETQVLRVLHNPILEQVTMGKFEGEAPLTYCVWTPDECFEIWCFEEPEFVEASANSDQTHSKTASC